MKLSRASLATLAAQAVNIAVAVAGNSSPHTAIVVGSALTLLQAIFPSVFGSVNVVAADQHSAP